MSIHNYFSEFKLLLDEIDIHSLEKVITSISGICYTVGNGGSSSTAEHLTNDLISVGIPSYCLNNSSVITAVGNDDIFTNCFSSQLVGASEKDTLVIFSVSSNSPNLLKVAEKAKGLNMNIIGFLGNDGGQLKEYLTSGVIVESHNYALIESLHLLLIHTIRL